MKAIVRKIVLPVLLAAIMLLAVRFLLLSHMTMPSKACLPDVRAGQRAFVSLTWYGLRLPGENLWGYHRLGYRQPACGELLVYRLPGTADNVAAVCRALPADTVWIDPVRQKVLPARTSPDAQPIVVPARRKRLRVTPYNAQLLAYLLTTYEHSRARVNRQRQLEMDGRVLLSVTLSKDYYWLETSPDVYAVVPHDALVGRCFPYDGLTETFARFAR